MSGNPMLSDAAFEKAGSVAVLDRGASPADEWARAQGMAGAQTMPPPTSTRNAAAPERVRPRSSGCHAHRPGHVARRCRLGHRPHVRRAARSVAGGAGVRWIPA